MSDSRTEVLARIGRALGRDAGPVTSVDEQPDSVRQRLHDPTRHTLPQVDGAMGDRVMGDGLMRSGAMVEQMIERMESVQMSVVRLQSLSDCIDAAADYLESEGIDGEVTVSPALSSLDWPTSYRAGAASGTETTGITPAFAAAAETGSVALVSGADTPNTLGFLPDNHIVILRESDVVPHVDDVLDRVRELATLPRAVNFVTGPSRTADIEQTLEIGAHGPRRVHVLLVSGDH